MSAPIPNTETDVINKMEGVRKRDHDYVPVKVEDEPDPKQPPVQPEIFNDSATDEEAANEGSSDDSTEQGTGDNESETSGEGG